MFRKPSARTHGPARALALGLAGALFIWHSVLARTPAAPLAPASSIPTAAPDSLPYQATSPKVLDLPEGERPVVVRVGFQLLDINRMDDESETFELSGVLTLVWRDSRQAFDPAQEGVQEKFYHGAYQFNEVSPSWYPQVVLANASGTCEKQGTLLRVKPDGTATLIEMVNAVARSPLDLRGFPFDHQRLEAIFVILGFDTHEVVLDLGPNAAVANLERVRVPQWTLTQVSPSVRLVTAPYAGVTGKSSAFVFTMDMKRQSWFMVRLVMAPLFMVVMLSWSVFWMGRSSLGERMSVSFVGILTAVAYQMVVSDILPQISYVTLMNAFLNFSFWIMCASVVVNLVVGAYDKRGDFQRGDELDRRCRWLFPLIYLVLISVSLAIALIWF